MKTLNQIWNNILAEVETIANPIAYRTWFLPLSPKRIDEDVHIFYIIAPKDYLFKADVLRDRYFSMLESAVETVLKKPYKVVVQTEEKNDNPKEKKGGKQSKTSLKEEFYFNPRYNFENFVVGENNKFAHAGALAVADAPSHAYNPFFIYGSSGLGKTHLMHAIGHYIMENHPKLTVLYVSSEMFTNEMILAIKDKTMNLFQNKYRNVDVLLIDDIQFLEKKEGIQEEFFHTFNTLFDLNKQIIISSDRAPNKLNILDDRLTSRFQWNLIADIQPPDYETRVAILTKKAVLENVEIDEDMSDIISLISEKIKFNIRELEGAFTRVISFSTLMNEKITMSFARDILKDIFSASDFNISCESIKKTVCKHFSIKLADMESSKRTRDLSFPRQLAMYLCREMTETSLPKIGDAFGGRDHTTVLHAYDKISGEIKKNNETAEVIQLLREKINET